MMSFTIRAAVAEDVPTILELIRGIAEYEKLSHEVVATEELLHKNLFGERPSAECLLGFEGNRVVGFALYFHNFSTFMGRPGLYLEDLFVYPEHRGKGYGKALLTRLAAIAVERDCGRMEWAVLDWNKPAIDFYRSLGARLMDGWTINRVTGEALVKMADMSK